MGGPSQSKSVKGLCSFVFYHIQGFVLSLLATKLKDGEFQLVEQTILKMNHNMQILQIPVSKFLGSSVNCLQLKDVWRALSSFSLSSASPPPVPRCSLVICCCHLTIEETPRCSSSPPSQQFFSTPSGTVAQKPVITELPASSSSLFSTLFSFFFSSSSSEISYGDLWIRFRHSSIVSDSKERRFSSF